MSGSNGDGGQQQSLHDAIAAYMVGKTLRAGIEAYQEATPPSILVYPAV
jgi:hypothetical protein